MKRDPEESPETHPEESFLKEVDDIKKETEDQSCVSPLESKKKARNRGKMKRERVQSKKKARIKAQAKPKEHECKMNTQKGAGDMDPENPNGPNSEVEAKGLTGRKKVDELIVELNNGELRKVKDLYSKVKHTEAPRFIFDERGKIECSICFTEVQETELKEHLEKVHENRDVFKCNICDKVITKYTAQSGLAHDHIKRFHVKEGQCPKCPKCSYLFWFKDRYERHIATCNRRYRKEGMCPVCGHIVRQLNKHMREIHPPHPSYCDICNAKCSNEYTLKVHKKLVHRAPENILCHICSKSFRNEFYYKGHMRKVHTTERFVCPFEGCGRQFKRKDNLKVHAMIHSDEKPLRCNYCDFACRQHNSLTVHMRTHHKDVVIENPKRKYVKTMSKKYM